MRRQTPLRPGRAPHRRIIIYWKMCRTCHRIGTRALSPVDRCTHPVEAVGICGQCGKKRPLVTCHRYDFRGLRSGAPHRATAIRTQNRKRKAANLERAHGPTERRLWIKTLPCANCGIVGFSEGAHIKNGGMSRKADADRTIPLCGWHVVSWRANDSCHASQHAYGWDSLPALNTRAKREAAAARTEELWQSHLRQTGRARSEESDNG